MNADLILNILELSLEIPNIELEYLSQITQLNYRLLLTLLGSNSYLKDGRQKIKLDSNFRINLAIYGIVNLNMKPYEVIKYLTWQEFEEFCLYVLERHEFYCVKNFRFSKKKHRFEIDIIGFHQPYIICIDAKQWRIRYGKISLLKKAVEKQIYRTEALSKVIDKFTEKLQITKWKSANLIPCIITSMDEAIKFHKGVPIIPFYQFNNFIANFFKFIEDLPQFKVRIKNHGAQTKLIF